MSYFSLTISLFLLISSSLVVAADNTVRFTLPDGYDRGSNSARVIDPGNFELYAEEGSDGGKESSGPGKIYVPIDEQDAGVVIESNFAVYNGIPTELTGVYTGAISVDLDVETADSTKRRVCAVAKGGSDLTGNWARLSITDSYGVINSSVNDIRTYGVNLFNLNSIMGDIDVNTVKTDIYIYFFLASLDDNGVDTCEDDVSDPIAIDSITGGTYIQLNISTDVPSGDTVVLADVSPRDEEVIARISSGNNISYAYKTATYKLGGVVGAGQTPAASQGSLYRMYNFKTSGDITIEGLINDTTYYFAVASVDKFLFATNLSQSHEVKPMAFEELLDQQGCYLLTAGFQEEHYVLEYFRDIRDTVLLKYKWGRIFVSWYYSTAPKYALLIQKNEFASSLIRGVGYFSYFLFNYIGTILLTIFLLTFLACWYKISVLSKYFWRTN